MNSLSPSRSQLHDCTQVSYATDTFCWTWKNTAKHMRSNTQILILMLQATMIPTCGLTSFNRIRLSPYLHVSYGFHYKFQRTLSLFCFFLWPRKTYLNGISKLTPCWGMTLFPCHSLSISLKDHSEESIYLGQWSISLLRHITIGFVAKQLNASFQISCTKPIFLFPASLENWKLTSV